MDTITLDAKALVAVMVHAQYLALAVGLVRSHWAIPARRMAHAKPTVLVHLLDSRPFLSVLRNSSVRSILSILADVLAHAVIMVLSNVAVHVIHTVLAEGVVHAT